VKKLAIAISILAATTVGAFAADMPTKAPVAPVVTVYDWSGFYIGLQGGGEWNTTKGVFYNDPAFLWHTDSKSQGMYGGFVGFQKQFGQFVLGIEGGGDAIGNGWASTVAGGLGAPCGFVAVVEACQSRIKDVLYVGGKAGYAWDRWMVYGTGGYAEAVIDTQGVVLPNTIFSPATRTHGGWYAGAGVDYAVLDYLILGVDYKHYEFDSNNHDSVIFIDRRTVSATMDAVMARVSLKFNPWPMGVVAKY
jgi:outer membrane immunogenic protein